MGWRQLNQQTFVKEKFAAHGLACVDARGGWRLYL